MKKAIVYCAGNNFAQYYERIIKHYEIVALTDSDQAKWGKTVMGKHLITPPDCTAAVDSDVVFIASDREDIICHLSEKAKMLWPNHEVESILSVLISRLSWDSIDKPIEWSDNRRNRIFIEGGNYINHFYFSIYGDDNTIRIGKNVHVKGSLSVIAYGDGNSLEIGAETSFVDTIINLGEGGTVSIGRDSMFASGIELFQYENHPIFDVTLGKRINQSECISIGNHVWVGRNATLMGGFAIGNNGIVGAGCVSSSQFGNNVCIGGNPARIIRENVTWGREALGLYEINDIDDLRI